MEDNNKPDPMVQAEQVPVELTAAAPTLEEPIHSVPAPVAPPQVAPVNTGAEPTTAAAPVDPKKRVLVGQTTSGVGVVSENPQYDTQLSLGPVENPHVRLEMEYTTPVMELSERKDLTGSTEAMFFFAERGPEVDDRIRAFVSPSALRTGKGSDWNESIVAAAGSSAFLDRRFETTTKREGSLFKQFLETETGKLGFTAPKIAEAGTTAYSGEKAVLRMRSLMGLGGVLSIPLWHSGFWITLSAPNDGALIELQRRLQEEKIELGRETFGLVFSNEESYINGWVLDFCMDHLYDHNVRVDNNNDLRPLIKIQDLNILFWGMACLIWPRGFDYVRSLTTQAGIENTTTISAKINLGKLMWVDNASFDEKHRAHMASRQRNKLTVESILEYQNTFIPTLAGGRRVEICPGVAVLVASTDVVNYIADGENWIAGIVQTIDSAYTQAGPNEKDRNRMISVHARASRLRNYGAWIKAVIIDEHENTERDTITKMLDIWSADETIADLITDSVTKFIDDSTRALIAIPETSGKDMGLPRFPHLIPLDVVNTFFTLLAQRVAIISRR